MRFATDENFDGHMLRGLRRRLPDLDVIRIQDTLMYQASDPDLLAWLAEENRILITHDVKTMPGFVFARVNDGLYVPGVIAVRAKTPVGDAIHDLEIMLGASGPEEFANQVRYIPIQ